ncbi:uncharacterized protein LOC123713617 [Pieris brassicae]|uniref:Uncharacterized protein n=1 Tax=Pieris brassicae TaxID=7116 RepID=A0A9P0XC14_PIEBR|nr:uncharacterized protein LOC123713617 [Pieris brassicae]CAH4030582.1 unnamed protein product [Pieris brassicae]
MSDIEEENMVTFRTGIGEISVGGFSRHSKNMSMNNVDINSNPYKLDLPQHDVRSMYRERAISPFSLRSDFGPPRFHPGQYASSHRSVINGRSRSPMSIRSVDSTRSVIDITNALKFESFNTHELQVIKEIVCRKLKLKLRRRYEKNRHKSMVLKSNRSNMLKRIRSLKCSDRDSSESPISSNEDDEHGLHKNMTVLTRPHMSQVDKSLLMNSINNEDKYTNHTIALKKNVFSIKQKASNKFSEVAKPDSTQTCNEGRTLKDYFPSEYMFPSQRFKNTTKSENNSNDIPRLVVSQESLSSENEDIFSDSENRKRSFDHQFSNNAKRIKLASNVTNSELIYLKDTFKKPLVPKLKDNSNAKEILISKAVPPSKLFNNINEDIQNESEESKLAEVSMKSSFSKRKLFTQKVDFLNSKALSDTAGASPQTKVDNKERNKTRKLVTTQSCLNRNVSDEEDNVLDLIHKIVPAEQIYATSSKTNTVPDDKYDSDVSGTFTDETLNGTVFEQTNIDMDKNTKLVSSSKAKHCRVTRQNVLPQNSGSSKTVFQRSNYMKTFWETDIESEMESENIPIWKISRPTRNKDNLKDVTLSTLNTTHQVGKNRAKILTVQDLKNKIANSKKRLNTATEIEQLYDQEQTIKKLIPKVVIENINNLSQFEPDKPGKEKKKTIASSNKNKNPNTQEVSNIQQSKRIRRPTKKYYECEDATTKAKKSKTNEGSKNSKVNSKASVTKSSLDTSDLNISSRTKPKRNKSDERRTSKENSIQRSDDILNISIKSLRPRKNKNCTF